MAGESRNSFARILFAGVVMVILGVALLISLTCRPEHVKNLLVVISAGVAYLLRRTERPRRMGKRRRRLKSGEERCEDPLRHNVI